MNIKKDETNKKYCVKRNKFRKFVYLKSSYIFDKTQFFLLFPVNAAIIIIEYLKKKKALRY